MSSILLPRSLRPPNAAFHMFVGSQGIIQGYQIQGFFGVFREVWCRINKWSRQYISRVPSGCVFRARVGRQSISSVGVASLRKAVRRLSSWFESSLNKQSRRRSVDVSWLYNAIIGYSYSISKQSSTRTIRKRRLGPAVGGGCQAVVRGVCSQPSSHLHVARSRLVALLASGLLVPLVGLSGWGSSRTASPVVRPPSARAPLNKQDLDAANLRYFEMVHNHVERKATDFVLLWRTGARRTTFS